MKKKTIFIGVVCLAIALFATFYVFNRLDKNDIGDEQYKTFQSGVIGEGEKSFKFTVVDVNGVESVFTARTDKETVGEALTDIGIIAGEAGPYGLYVKTVNGTNLDFSRDGKYWAFYVNGQYAITGVDKTKIDGDTVYTFKVE